MFEREFGVFRLPNFNGSNGNLITSNIIAWEFTFS